MKELHISIYKGDVSYPTTAIKIPLTALKIVNALIPKIVKEKVLGEGIDLKEIIKATETEGASGKLVEIQSKDERIVISVE